MREKPQTPQDILDAIDRGEITRGDKGDKRFTVGDTELVFYPASGTLRYTHNGVSVEAALKSNDTIDTIHATEADTGTSVFDTQLIAQHRQYIEQLLSDGHVPFE